MSWLVSGAGGLLGRALATRAAADGTTLRSLVRRPPANEREFAWSPTEGGFDDRALSGCEAVIHLAGEPVAGGRWNAARKRRIEDSRVLGTRLLASRIAAAPQPPAVLICASAVGFYGNRGDEMLDEAAAPGEGFLARTCAAWERAADPARAVTRVVYLRFGVILARHGGALGRMLPAFRLGLGGRLGNGQHWMPWLTLDDAVDMVHHAHDDERLRGPVNAVAGAVRNVDFTRALGRALRRPTVLPVPSAALRLLLGELADELLLASQRAEPGRLRETGFAPRFQDLGGALNALLRKQASRA